MPVKTPFFSSKKSVAFGFSSKQESISPFVLPTSAPSSPNVQYTLASTVFPTVTGSGYSTIRYSAQIAAACSVGASAATISYAMAISTDSGASWATITSSSQSVLANKFFTVQAFFSDVASGSTIMKGISMWSNLTGTSLHFRGRDVFPDKVVVGDFILRDFGIYSIAERPTYTVCNPSDYATLSGSMVVFGDNGTINFDSGCSGRTFSVYRSSTFGLWHSAPYTIANTFITGTDSAYFPYYKKYSVMTNFNYYIDRLGWL